MFICVYALMHMYLRVCEDERERKERKKKMKTEVENLYSVEIV